MSVVWSYDATRLASASWDETAKIWDPTTGEYVSTLKRHSKDIVSIASLHDTIRLASVSDNGIVKIWDPATGKWVSTVDSGYSIHRVQFHISNAGFLYTDRSTLNLAHFADLSLGPVFTDRLSREVVKYGLSSNRSWITYQGEKLIWLPSEHRASCFRVSGTILSIGCYTGRVLFFKFSEGEPTM